MNKTGSEISISNLRKVYRCGETFLTVLDGLDLSLRGSGITAVIGRSGSGKTTLLNIIGGLDSSTEGEVVVKGRHIEQLNENELSLFRNRHIGFVFQFHNLLSEFTVLENVIMPALISNKGKDRDVRGAKARAMELLRTLEIDGRAHFRPGRLSGGESQRVAIARALINKPDIILADEPTGNLDLKTSETIIDLLFRTVRIYSGTLLIVTHNPAVVREADATYRLSLGKLIPLAR